MGEILFALPLVRAPALADADVHARIVPFFLTNDIIRHCTLLWHISDAASAGIRHIPLKEARGFDPVFLL
jgi:hypothetical protein